MKIEELQEENVFFHFKERRNNYLQILVSLP